MRTPLLLAAAAAVVASTAAAANFDVNAADTTLDDASSGTSTIEDCTAALHLDVLHSDTYDDTINDWYVTGVRVTAAGHDLTEPVNLLDTCLDLALSVAIDDGQDANHIVLGPVVLDASSVTDGIIDLPVPADTLIPASNAHEVSALVERNLDALVPPTLIRVTGSHGGLVAEVLDRDGSDTPTVGDAIVLGEMPLELDWSRSTSGVAGEYEVTAVQDRPAYLRLTAGTRYIDFEFDTQFGLEGNHVDFVGFVGCYFHIGHGMGSTTLYVFNSPSCAYSQPSRQGPSAAGPIAVVDYIYRD